MYFKDDIGSIIKDARQRQGITLREVSEKTNISVGFLSQFERGICNISIDSLAKVAEALDISVVEFFQANDNNDQTKYHISRPHEISPAQVNNHAILYHLCNSKSAFLPRIHVLLPFASNSQEEIATYTHDGEEFIYVLEGILTVLANGKKEILYPGDSIYLLSGVEHNWVNLSNKIVKVLSINYPNPLAN